MRCGFCGTLSRSSSRQRWPLVFPVHEVPVRNSGVRLTPGLAPHEPERTLPL
ncbi:metallo-beta-lactamase [Mobiluncus mulieris]|nr:metallo-beta-lactamase [Mobiluncus mulieris]